MTTHVYIVADNVDLGYHVHSVWDTERDAKEAVRLLTDAYRLSYPTQDWEHKYMAIPFEVRSGVHTLTSSARSPQPPPDASP